MVEAVKTSEVRTERVYSCPLCESERLHELPARNLNSRDRARTERLAGLLGSDFFVAQKLSICLDCSHVFQSTRPAPEALEQLYENFAATVAKRTPSSEAIVEYFMKENSKDYVDMAAACLAFLDRHELLAGVDSAFELRTYGGGLLAILRERGVSHIEGAYIQDFDAEMARRVFGIGQLVPFSFARPLSELRPSRDAYDLIVAYEGLTHSPRPVELLAWVRDHLAESGRAVFFREPNTPAYRQFMPLEMVFNNFHMNLLTRQTTMALVEKAGGLEAELHDEYHPNFSTPLYVNAILRPGKAVSAPAPSKGERYGADYYRSWIAWDTHPVLRPVGQVRRGLSRVGRGVAGSVSTEVRTFVRARRG